MQIFFVLLWLWEVLRAAFILIRWIIQIRDVAAVPKEQMETVEIGVYVLEEDPAQDSAGRGGL